MDHKRPYRVWVSRVVGLVPGRGWQELGRAPSTICWHLFGISLLGWPARLGLGGCGGGLESERMLLRFVLGDPALHERQTQSEWLLSGALSAWLKNETPP